jgi:putative transposase
MNRAARRARLFSDDDDYQLFLMCLAAGLRAVPLRLYAYCVMPNHFHLVARPGRPEELGRFMRFVTGTHGQRWNQNRGSVGTGAVYQGRYRAIPIQQDLHFLTVCRYVERNPLRAQLVKRAEEWPWSSLYQRCRNCHIVSLAIWPVPQPSNWLEQVNQLERQTDEAVRAVTAAGSAFGTDAWRRQATAERRRRGRPRKIGSGRIFTSDVKMRPDPI